MFMVCVPLVVFKGFSGGTRVTFIIFIQKPGFTALFYLSGFVSNKKILRKAAILVVL